MSRDFTVTHSVCLCQPRSPLSCRVSKWVTPIMYVSEGGTPVISVATILSCHTISRLQNSRVFFSKSVKKSVKRGVRVLHARSARASHARRAFSVSPQSRFQPRSRPFVSLLALTWIRKNTDCFAVYTIRVNKKEKGFRPRSSRLRRSSLTPALDLVAKKKNARDCSKSFDKPSYLPPQKRLLSPL